VSGKDCRTVSRPLAAGKARGTEPSMALLVTRQAAATTLKKYDGVAGNPPGRAAAGAFTGRCGRMWQGILGSVDCRTTFAAKLQPHPASGSQRRRRSGLRLCYHDAATMITGQGLREPTPGCASDPMCALEAVEAGVCCGSWPALQTGDQPEAASWGGSKPPDLSNPAPTLGR